MNHHEIVTEKDRYLMLRRKCDEIFIPGRRLPDLVFQPKILNFLGFEHGMILDDTFPQFLFQMSKSHSDSHVNYMTISPDPVDYYKHNCDFYGLASFSSEKIVEKFVPVMSLDGSADSFLVRGGDVGVFWGSSMQWGIFCDRKTWDICILGSAIKIDYQLHEKMGFMSFNKISTFVTNEYAARLSLARDFLSVFRSSYKTMP